MDSSQLDPKTREDMIRRAWYAHDARWFALGLALLSLLIAGLLRLIGRRDGTAPQVPEGQ